MNIRELAERIAESLPGRLGQHSVRIGESLSPVATGWLQPPFNDIAEQEPCDDVVAACAGYLHDTVEDGYMTLLGIRAIFGKAVSDAVDAVSRRLEQGETYAQFIVRAASHPIGRLVKLADVRDNLATMHKGMEHLRPRYRAALLVLEP